jgi:hypothetical protein
MVEFDSVDSAKRAKQALHGCDIYSGCCTLRIEYAKVFIFSNKYQLYSKVNKYIFTADTSQCLQE